ncbi:PREDICTED: cation/H(+) antiporter 15 [Theobroma cacao]|uniref:Cation/H(+) antiporter 15 n=1 Tax=Theobroma cacao TaxID=3641 RepID=A0AB32V5W7_THECC|nr:PREDICTED: cation/H(+) antiporter 15 [Theobroma cacao]
MEPDDIVILKSMPNFTSPNFTHVCSTFSTVQSIGIFYFNNPLNFMLPVLLIQMSLASAAILVTFHLLRPLGQPIMVAQILAGIIVGPSFLCRIPGLLDSLFPMRSFVVMDVVSAIGFMFYFFLIGVQIDVWILKRINRQNFAIGFFTVAVPMILTIGSSVIWAHFVDADGNEMDALVPIAQAESVLSFPAIAYYLSELRVINSDFGKVALCSSIVSWLCSFCVITFNVLFRQSGKDMFLVFKTISCALGFAALIFFFLGPLLLWQMKRNTAGQPLKQSNLIVLFLAVVMAGFWGHYFGLHIYFGPFLFGLMIPSGPPLGSALVEKLDLVTYWIWLPLYFVKFGLAIDIFAISLKTYSTVFFIALLGACGKFLGASLSALSCQMPLRDAVSLGFVMNFQGILEIGMFKLMKNAKIIDAESFTAMCTASLFIMGVITPMVRHYCDPSEKYRVYHGRTVMHSRPNSELKLLVCIHDQENVPSAINLLGALNPSKQSPIAVHLLHLIELTGSATPLLIPHKITKSFSSRSSGSGPVINAFKHFQEIQGGTVSVIPFTSISLPQTMHDDVCAIALDKGTSLVIIPFYKRFHVNGASQSSKQAIKIATQNVLTKAPCSVSILVDRGPPKTQRALWTSWSSYKVAVIFLGGADDREALALGARMAGQPNINLSLIRILYDGNFPKNYMEESRLDNEIINEFKTDISGKYSAMYREEVVMEGAGTAAVLRTLENQYELVVVGRRNDGLPPLLSGLTEWIENKELGVIGDLLASSDFLGNTSILVVQQHIDSSHGD